MKNKKRRKTNKNGGAKFRVPNFSFLRNFFTRKNQTPIHPQIILDSSNHYSEYCRQFVECKKNLLDRFTNRGACKELSKDLSKYSLSNSDYLLKKDKYNLLMRIIKGRIATILDEEKDNPKLIHRVSNYVRGKMNRIVNKAVKEFYVRTSHPKVPFLNLQKLYDIRMQENQQPPKDTPQSVVFPAYFYLTQSDIASLIEYGNKLLQQGTEGPTEFSYLFNHLVSINNEEQEKQPLDNEPHNVSFVTPSGFASLTGLQLKKIKEPLIFDKETKEYARRTAVISLEMNRFHSLFCLHHPFRYVAIEVNGTTYVIDINDQGFQEDFMTRVKEILNPRNPESIFTRLGALEQIGLKVEYLTNILSNPTINITQESKEEITRLNERMNCPNYHLELDYGYKLGDDSSLFNTYNPNLCVPMLCLFEENTCISSIELEFDEDTTDEVGIKSVTNPTKQGNHYNKLLRAAMILVVPKLDPNIRFINSVAMNPSSAYLSIKYFNGTPRETKEKFVDPMTNEVSFDLIKNYIDRYRILPVRIDLRNPTTISSAENVFQEIVDSGEFRRRCVISVGGKKKK